jgi:hypothetical protein
VYSQRSCRIAGDGDAGRNALRDYRAHADDGTCADFEWLAGPTLPDDAAGTEIGTITYHNIAIAANARRKRDEIADAAVVLHTRVQVRMKVAPDAHV